MAVHALAEAARRPHDVCVIGSGPAGVALALELERAGIDVLVLESGLDRVSPAHQALAAAESFDPARHDDMLIATARRLGGASNLWGARCQPFDPIDFEPSASRGDGRWPIGREAFEPHFARAAEILSCGDPVFSAPFPELGATDPAFDATRLERFSNVPAVQKAHRDRLLASPGIGVCLDATVVSADFEGDRAVAVAARSLGGETVTIRARRFVVACGGLESTRLLLALQRRKPDLCGGPGGALGRHYMSHVIGEVADVTFDSPALDAGLDFTIDGHGSYARRRLIPADDLQRAEGLPNISFWPVVPPVSDASHRHGVLSMVFLAFAIAPLGRLLVAEAIRKRHVHATPIWPHVVNVLRDLPRTAVYLPTFLWRRYVARMRLPGFFLRNPGRTYGLSYHAEQRSSAESGVSLGAETDALGLPRLRIDLRFDRADAEGVYAAHRALDAWLRRNRLGRVSYRQPEAETVDAILRIAAHGTHQIGTARMADHPSRGAVDADLRCFGTSNLYVCSSAVFPTSGQCNPTFSIVALACRLAAHLTQTRVARADIEEAVPL
jgi:choline dehydrogenase-like flavoprotein